MTTRVVVTIVHADQSTDTMDRLAAVRGAVEPWCISTSGTGDTTSHVLDVDAAEQVEPVRQLVDYAIDVYGEPSWVVRWSSPIGLATHQSRNSLHRRAPVGL